MDQATGVPAHDGVQQRRGIVQKPTGKPMEKPWSHACCDREVTMFWLRHIPKDGDPLIPSSRFRNKTCSKVGCMGRRRDQSSARTSTILQIEFGVRRELVQLGNLINHVLHLCRGVLHGSNTWTLHGHPCSTNGHPTPQACLRHGKPTERSWVTHGQPVRNPSVGLGRPMGTFPAQLTICDDDPWTTHGWVMGYYRYLTRKLWEIHRLAKGNGLSCPWATHGVPP